MTLRYQYRYKGPEFNGVFEVIENLSDDYETTLFEITGDKAAQDITTVLNRQAKFIKESNQMKMKLEGTCPQ